MHLSRCLNPIIQEGLREYIGELPWTNLLFELDRSRDKKYQEYKSSDLHAQLNMLTERLGDLGYPFDNSAREVSTLGSELRIVRNRWAHHDEFSALDAWRCHDFCVRLLEYFNDVEGVAAAEKYRDAAFAAVNDENGTAARLSELSDYESGQAEKTDEEDEYIAPSADVSRRKETRETPTIGSGRSAYEPWQIVVFGDIAVLDDLPKKSAKEQVRAVATEIAEFEGPIHINRLISLTAASFCLYRVHSKRKKQLERQIGQCGLFIDRHKFVWPSDIDPETWVEFRPNDSKAGRDFEEISPIEIRNAKIFLETDDPLA